MTVLESKRPTLRELVRRQRPRLSLNDLIEAASVTSADRRGLRQRLEALFELSGYIEAVADFGSSLNTFGEDFGASRGYLFGGWEPWEMRREASQKSPPAVSKGDSVSDRFPSPGEEFLRTWLCSELETAKSDPGRLHSVTLGSQGVAGSGATLEDAAFDWVARFGYSLSRWIARVEEDGENYLNELTGQVEDTAVCVGEACAGKKQRATGKGKSTASQNPYDTLNQALVAATNHMLRAPSA